MPQRGPIAQYVSYDNSPYTRLRTITFLRLHDIGTLLPALHHCNVKRGIDQLWICHDLPDPPLAEVQVAEEERLLDLGTR